MSSDTHPLMKQLGDDAKREFYDELQSVVGRVKPHDVLVVMGNLNAKVGSDDTNLEKE